MASAKSAVHRAPWWHGEESHTAGAASVEVDEVDEVRVDEAPVIRNEGDQIALHIMNVLTSDETATVNVWPDMSVAELKELMVVDVGVPACYQQLTMGDSKLKDEATLGSYAIDKDNSTLHLTRTSPPSPIEDLHALCSEPANSQIWLHAKMHAAYLLQCIVDQAWSPNIRNPYEVPLVGYIFEDYSEEGLFTNEDGTLLTRAASVGHSGVCEALLNDSRLTVSGMVDGKGVTALMHAAYQDRVGTCTLLLGHDAFTEVNNMSRFGSALHYALWQNPFQKFQIHFAVEELSDAPQACARVLLDSPRFDAVNAKNSNEQSALHLAAHRGFADVCRLLLQDSRFTETNSRCKNIRLSDSSYGTDYNPRHPLTDATALHAAAASGHADVCRELLNSDRFTAVEATTKSDYHSDLLAIHCVAFNPEHEFSAETFSVLEADPRVNVEAQSSRGTIIHILKSFWDSGDNYVGELSDISRSRYENTLRRMVTSEKIDLRKIVDPACYEHRVITFTISVALDSERPVEVLCHSWEGLVDKTSHEEEANIQVIKRRYGLECSLLDNGRAVPLRALLKDYSELKTPPMADFPLDFRIIDCFQDCHTGTLSSETRQVIFDRFGVKDHLTVDPGSSVLHGEDLDESTDAPSQKELHERSRFKSSSMAHKHQKHIREKQMREKQMRQAGHLMRSRGGYQRGARVKVETYPQSHDESSSCNVTKRDAVAGTHKLVHMAYSMELPGGDEEDDDEGGEAVKVDAAGNSL